MDQGPDETQTDPRDNRTLKMRAVRTRAAIGLSWESFWPLAVPPVIVAMLFAAVSWLGLWQGLPAAGRYVLLAVFAAGLLYALSWLRDFRLPTHAAITRRIEQSSELEDRPIIAQQDALAMGEGDELSRAMWAEHQKRMAERLKDLRSGNPAPDANRTDPWALRAFAAVIAFAAFGFSWGHQSGSISDAFAPPQDRAELLSRLDAWINPPAYTRKPPIYLTRQVQQVSAEPDESDPATSAPQGSDFVLRFVGEGDVQLAYNDGQETVSIEPDAAEDKPAPANRDVAETHFTHKLETSGTMIFLSRGEEIGRWAVEILPDAPPSIRFSEMPSSALSGSLQLNYEVEDDYGVVQAEARFKSMVERDPQARPLVEPPHLTLPLPRHRAKQGSSKTNRDLTQHPWAGSEVEITLVATDDPGQSGMSAPHKMTLPGRQFSNPLARAVIEQRRILALDARKSQHVADMLDAVLTAPDEFIDSAATVAGLSMVRRRVIDAWDDDGLRDALDLMWEISLAIEFGDLSEAERRLREAQERLSDALENGASDEEIDRLMEELRQAMNEFMRQLAQEALQNPMAQNPFGQNEMTRMLSQRDLERMMDQIEDLAKSGSKDAARQLLSEMQRMMDNLRAGRHMQQRQAEGNRTNQALDKLSELMREQQRLMDESFRMQQQQQQMQQGQQGQQQQQGQRGQQQQGQQGQQGEQRPMTPEEFAEALEQLRQQQQALQQQLEQLGEDLEALGLDPSEQFGEAGREMGEAGDNLQGNNPGGAAGDQGQALEALRGAAQSMMQQMAGDRQQGGQDPGEGQNGGPDRQRSDPLGRSERADGLENSENTDVPSVIDAQRAREIMEAIRRRLTEPGSPLIERDYLERLLDLQR